MTDYQLQNDERQFPRKDALEALLNWLSADNDQAGLIYERLRRKLVEFFARRGAPTLFWHELADETLDRIGRKLAEGETIHNPEPTAYAFGVARYVLSEFWRRQRRRVESETQLDDLSPHDRVEISAKDGLREERQETELMLGCLDSALKALPPEDEALMRTCHHDNLRQQTANRRQAAKQLNWEENSLRVHLHRIRQTLQRKVRACVERQQKNL